MCCRIINIRRRMTAILSRTLYPPHTFPDTSLDGKGSYRSIMIIFVQTPLSPSHREGVERKRIRPMTHAARQILRRRRSPSAIALSHGGRPSFALPRANIVRVLLFYAFFFFLFDVNSTVLRIPIRM